MNEVVSCNDQLIHTHPGHMHNGVRPWGAVRMNSKCINHNTMAQTIGVCSVGYSTAVVHHHCVLKFLRCQFLRSRGASTGGLRANQWSTEQRHEQAAGLRRPMRGPSGRLINPPPVLLAMLAMCHKGLDQVAAGLTITAMSIILVGSTLF